jgi:hypothetical protein
MRALPARAAMMTFFDEDADMLSNPG